MCPLDPQIAEKIIQLFLKKQKGPRIAAFDADGTLWDADVGELFLEYQIQKKFVKDLSLEQYQHLRSHGTPHTAIAKLATINKGHKISAVHQLAQEHFQMRVGFPYFPSQAALIRELHKIEVTVFVVTASVSWAVMPFAKHLFGISPQYVLGTEAHIENHYITDRVSDIVFREGKRHKLLEKTGGYSPDVAFGNTLGDLDFMELAALPVAVQSTTPKNKNHITPIRHHQQLYQGEQALKKIAHERHWLSHSFV